tara:strand:+ start:885 stop:1034 length:150 start_codon:yes stop_codon:yes gene_type:complete
MLKVDWEKALEEMERMHKVAINNVDEAQKQAEELEFNISNYREKITTFK